MGQPRRVVHIILRCRMSAALITVMTYRDPVLTAGNHSFGSCQLVTLRSTQQLLTHFTCVSAAHRDITDIGVSEQPSGGVATQFTNSGQRYQIPAVRAYEPGRLPVLLQP